MQNIPKKLLARHAPGGALALAGAVLFLTAAARSQTPPETIPAGTEVVVSLADTLKSGQARTGEPVRYTVTKDVSVGGVVRIPAGTPAQGVVETSRGAGALGRAGRLRVRCDAVVLPSGLRVPLREREPADALGHSSAGMAVATAGLVGLVVGVVTYTGVNVGTNLFNDPPDFTGPTLAGLGAGLVSGLLVGSLFHGSNVTLDAGRRFDLVVARDTPLGAASVGPDAP